MDVINIIKEHSLTVRCLPFITVNHWSYRDGDENKKYVDSKGNEIEATRTVIVQKFDLEYFKNTPPSKYNKDQTPEQRLNYYLKGNPSGERKLLREERTVKNGGWWYVKETKNTDSTVKFSREYDFFAPTLEEALQLYLNSIKTAVKS